MLFGERLAQAVREKGAPACVGLDPHLDRLPAPLRARFESLEGPARRAAAASAVTEFFRMVIDEVAPLVPAVKPQFAFFEALGAPGWAALEHVSAYARQAGLVVVGDAKRGDIASTARAYAFAALDPEGPVACDALTVNPWMGRDTLTPFVDLCRDHGRGLFALVRTTNPGSADLQGLGDPPAAHAAARLVTEVGVDLVGPSGLSSIGAVVGAQTPDEARVLRELMPQAWFLVPGYGAQGGGAADALAGRREDGLGSLVNSARAVLFGPSTDSDYDRDPATFIRARATDLVEDLRRVLGN